MVKVVFVDDPTQHNAHPELASVGTRSFRRLVAWIRTLKPDYYVVLNREPHLNQDKIAVLYDHGFDVIALGKIASTALHKANIPHFMVPHPSSLSRSLEDMRIEESALRCAKRYITKGNDCESE